MPQEPDASGPPLYRESLDDAPSPPPGQCRCGASYHQCWVKWLQYVQIIAPSTISPNSSVPWTAGTREWSREGGSEWSDRGMCACWGGSAGTREGDVGVLVGAVDRCCITPGWSQRQRPSPSSGVTQVFIPLLSPTLTILSHCLAHFPPPHPCTPQRIAWTSPRRCTFSYSHTFKLPLLSLLSGQHGPDRGDARVEAGRQVGPSHQPRRRKDVPPPQVRGEAGGGGAGRGGAVAAWGMGEGKPRQCQDVPPQVQEAEEEMHAC